MKMQVFVNKFYPEEFRRKSDAERYHSKGTCEVHLLLGSIEMDLKNITYRIDHEGKVSLKPPFRVHSNKKAGIKPKLVPSIVFKEPGVWVQIEHAIKFELFKKIQDTPKNKKECIQLDFWGEVS
ncbi:MAG: hypothetical protein KDK56_05630 [Simkania sp.]|nr:hypothetical protein [Simkania sp.]